MKSLKIYIAAPYTADTMEQMEANVRDVIDASLVLYAKGHFPYVPHLTHFIDMRAKELGIEMKWEDYIRWDNAWLLECDAFLYLSGSRGADLELIEAKKAGLTIYTSIEEVPTVEIIHGDYGEN
jgi:hypothetical protein